MLEISKNLQIPDKELTWRFSTPGGPGGQHANRNSTKVEVTFVITDSEALSERQQNILQQKFGSQISAAADDTRSQHRNREIALERLAEKISRSFVKPKKRKPTKPTKSSKERKLKDKRRRSQQIAERRTDY